MRILVVKMSSLGDLFHALPAVHGLKVGLDATVDWVANTQYRQLVSCFSDVERVIAFPRNALPAHGRAFLRELRKHDYDVVVDLQGLLKSAVVARLARGRIRIGPSFHREGAGFLYSAVAGKRNKNRHAVEENLDMVDYFGVARGDIVYPMRLPQANVEGRHPRVAILPVSRWPSKNWPPECFAAVGRRLKEVAGASLFLLGGPDDADPCAQVARLLNGDVVNMAGKTTLVEMGTVLKDMDLLLANDSGPVHMSVAVGTRALVIFGPTDPLRTGPYGPGHRVAKVDMACRPCFSRTCRQADVPCLKGITPESVAETALEMLEGGSYAGS